MQLCFIFSVSRGSRFADLFSSKLASFNISIFFHLIQITKHRSQGEGNLLLFTYPFWLQQEALFIVCFGIYNSFSSLHVCLLASTSSGHVTLSCCTGGLTAGKALSRISFSIIQTSTPRAHLPLFLLAPTVCVGGMWLSPSPKHHAVTTSGAGFFSSSSAKPLRCQHRFGSCHLIFCAFHPNNLLSANNFVLTICIHTCLS